VFVAMANVMVVWALVLAGWIPMTAKWD